ncbi:hypothetical protein GQ54DRAFT_292419 [Martensiomyces pterosporus]|nr:hypothetical protein GQ54DRAFT_292419 [Martensiomyces pterosporus]
MRLCLQQLNREGSEEPEQANLFLSACKFLDLLFILGTDDFLVHQWVFITDTIDALYGSRSASYALLDLLSSRLLSMPSKRSKRGGLSEPDLQTLGSRPLKRPIIRIRSVTSIRDLDAFVHNASVQAYQTAYTMAEPDMEFIEALLVSDLLYFDFGGAASTTPAAAPLSHNGEYEHEY